MLASKGFSTEDRNSAASGGNNTYTYTHANVDYKIHKFTADGTFTVNFSVPIDVLIIGGGGSGASLFGGGGAGALRWLTNQHIVSGTSAVTIGAGGARPTSESSNSSHGNSGNPSQIIINGDAKQAAGGGYGG